ncbi:MAG: proton-conducting membrane transporter [Lachnospiraceae bacterium]|nr:proton-conducting membrane transporter [Lachnospiraceae bacterium]
MEVVSNKRQLHIGVMITLLVMIVISLWLAFFAGDWEFECIRLLDDVSLVFKVDEVSGLFIAILDIAWICAGIYSFVYMKHEGKEERFYAFYLIAYLALAAMDFAGNLVTMYMCFELVTLSTFPLVMHSGSRESIMASLKYLLYSMCGAYMALFGIFVLYRYSDSITFAAGGTLSAEVVSEKPFVVLLAVFLMVIGFGVKCGMFPLHSWLTAAHPVAPSPASAVLSALIVKAGVLGIFRSVFYIVGAETIRGTWVQYAWMILTLMTVFMGSMLAFREQILKKRLAYSTVSQVSYILFGFATLDSTAVTGSLLHVVYHAIIKSGLFLIAGVFLVNCNKRRVGELVGIGKEMPVLLWSYTFLSLGLIGIPPTGGFISKWYLAVGSLETSGIGAFRWVGPMILLISALLTAGYLLPITMRGFFPGDGFDETKVKRKEPDKQMLLPIVALAALTVLLGVFPNFVIDYASAIAKTIL